jgi:hypothetical protein
MADLKYKPVPHDHEAFMAQASARKRRRRMNHGSVAGAELVAQLIAENRESEHIAP